MRRDPTRYFEFIFRDVKVTQATYRDGTCAYNGDSMIGQRILLNGMMVDVSPSAICGQLFAATLKVGNLLMGNLNQATQSELRINLRPLNTPLDGKNLSDRNYGAHVDTILDVTDITSPKSSRFLRELGDVSKLEFHMHLNNYHPIALNKTQIDEKNGLNGDVYGYICPTMPVIDSNGTRIKNRRLVAHQELDKTKNVRDIFLGPDSRFDVNTDIDGTYDLFIDKRILILRYLDFIPLLDPDGNTPKDKRLIVKYILHLLTSSGNRILIGNFWADRNEIRIRGGISVFYLDASVIRALKSDDMTLLIEVEMADGLIYPLMIESDLDILLENISQNSTDGVHQEQKLENIRGLTLGSSQKGYVTARVYYRNHRLRDHKVRLITQDSSDNPDSPIVASFEENEMRTNSEGLIKATIKTIKLEESQLLYDPVTKGYFEGDLPWSRYYGNDVYIQMDNPMRKFRSPNIEQIEIPIRVCIQLERTYFLNQNSVLKIISTLFYLSIMLSYFPWLHSRDAGENVFNQLLNLKNLTSVNDYIAEIIRRLGLIKIVGIKYLQILETAQLTELN